METASTKKICPVCDRHFEDAEDLFECPDDQSVLVFEAQDPYIGSTISKRYEVLALIGKGATSTVYKARETDSGSFVALKILHPHLANEGPVVRRLQQEAKSLKEFKHDNVVEVKHFSTTRQGQPYLVMEFLDGMSLFERLHQEGPLSDKDCLDVFCQICDGLSAAHERGIVHRDLKPGNIMLVPSPYASSGDALSSSPAFWRVKILDFGIAKIFPMQGETFFRLTQTGEMMGSLLYMSPEQCLEQDWDQRADIYSLGCVMYETLTGKPPLFGRTAFETMNKHLSEAPRPLSVVRPDLTVVPGLETVVLKCMAKAPAERYQSVDELKADLLALKAGKRLINAVNPNAIEDGAALNSSPVITTEHGTWIEHASLKPLIVLLMLMPFVMMFIGFRSGLEVGLGWLVLVVGISLPAIFKLQRKVVELTTEIGGELSQHSGGAVSVKAQDKVVRDLFSLLAVGAPGMIVVPAAVFLFTHQLFLALWAFYGMALCVGANLVALWVRMGGRKEAVAHAAAGELLPFDRNHRLISLTSSHRAAFGILAFGAIAAPLFLLVIKSVTVPSYGAFTYISFLFWAVLAGLFVSMFAKLTRLSETFNYVPVQFKASHKKYLAAMNRAPQAGALPLGALESQGLPVLDKKVFSLPPVKRGKKPHIFITGLPSMGKSRLMASFLTHDIESADRSILAIDGNGQLIDLILAWVGSEPNSKRIANRIDLVDLLQVLPSTAANANAIEIKDADPDKIDSREMFANRISLLLKEFYDVHEHAASEWTKETLDLVRDTVLLLVACERPVAEIYEALTHRNILEELIASLEAKISEDARNIALGEVWRVHWQTAQSGHWLELTKPVEQALAVVEPYITFLTPFAWYDWRSAFKQSIAGKRVVLIKGANHHALAPFARLLIKEYAETATSLSQPLIGDEGGSGKGARAGTQATVYIDDLDKLLLLQQYLDAVKHPHPNYGIIASAESLGFLNSTAPVQMDEALIRNASWLGGLCVFRCTQEDAKVVGPSILPRQEGIPKPSHVLKLRHGEGKPNGMKEEWLADDYFPKEWERQAKLVTDLPAQTYFWHEIGIADGVLRLVAPKFPDIASTEVDWSVVDEIKQRKLFGAVMKK
ncbi:MAG TPA: serine/threonine-protein kinase [Candidatus Obscuribacterales bacterium]